MRIERKEYLEQLIRKKQNGMVKVITGIRRSGKSYLLKEIYREYLYDAAKRGNSFQENSTK